MTFEMQKSQPSFFYKRKISKAENEFLCRMKKEDEIRFFNYISSLVKKC